MHADNAVGYTVTGKLWRTNLNLLSISWKEVQFMLGSTLAYAFSTGGPVFEESLHVQQ